MKAAFLFIALAAAILFAPELHAVSGMVPDIEKDAGQRQEETKGGHQFEKDRKEKGGGEDVSAQGRQDKAQKTAPRKRPRLKFFDEPKCAC